MAKQVKKWITINGNHVPVYEDGSLGGIGANLQQKKDDEWEDYDEQDKLEAIAERYTGSKPVSGNWDTEVEHEQNAIAEAFHISKEEAKQKMIDELGFEEDQFNDKSSKSQFGEAFDNQVKEYTDKFLTKRSDEEIEEIKKNLDKSTAIVGTTEDDHVAYKAIEDEQKRRYSDEHRSKTGPLHSMTDDQVMEAAFQGDRNAIDEMSKRGLSTTKDLREYKNRQKGSKPSLDDIKGYGYDPHDATGDPTIITADGRSYYKIGDDKWVAHSDSGRTLSGSISDKQMAERLSNAKDIKVNPAAKPNTSVESKLRESLRKYNRPDADKEAYNMVEAYKKGQIEPERLKMWGITDEELKSLSQAGRKEAQSDIDSGRAKKTVIDPLGNLRRVNKKTAYEKNYGEDLPRKGKSIKIGDKELSQYDSWIKEGKQRLEYLKDKPNSGKEIRDLQDDIRKWEDRASQIRNESSSSIKIGDKEVVVEKTRGFRVKAGYKNGKQVTKSVSKEVMDIVGSDRPNNRYQTQMKPSKSLSTLADYEKRVKEIQTKEKQLRSLAGGNHSGLNEILTMYHNEKVSLMDEIRYLKRRK